MEEDDEVCKEDSAADPWGVRLRVSCFKEEEGRYAVWPWGQSLGPVKLYPAMESSERGPLPEWPGRGTGKEGPALEKAGLVEESPREWSSSMEDPAMELSADRLPSVLGFLAACVA